MDMTRSNRSNKSWKFWRTIASGAAVLSDSVKSAAIGWVCEAWRKRPTANLLTCETKSWIQLVAFSQLERKFFRKIVSKSSITVRYCESIKYIKTFGVESTFSGSLHKSENKINYKSENKINSYIQRSCSKKMQWENKFTAYRMNLSGDSGLRRSRKMLMIITTTAGMIICKI